MDNAQLSSVYRVRNASGVDAPPMPRAVLSVLNPLAQGDGDANRVGPAIGADLPDGGVVVAWSGWLGEPAASADGMVERDFRTWSGAGRAALDAFVGALEPSGDGASGPLWLRPHHRHVLSDAPSCAAFLKAHESLVGSGRIGMFLDVGLLIDESMAGTREDHVDRVIERLAPLDGVRAISMHGDDWDALDARLRDLIEARGIPMLEPLR